MKKAVTKVERIAKKISDRIEESKKQEPLGVVEKFRTICNEIDYSDLPKDRQDVLDLGVVRNMTQEYEVELAKVTEEMEQLKPNHKAVDQLEDSEKTVEEKAKDANEARKKS